MALSEIGLVGLAVMGQVRDSTFCLKCITSLFVTNWENVGSQNLALNIAEKGFPISVYNRTYEKTELAEQRAQKEGMNHMVS